MTSESALTAFGAQCRIFRRENVTVELECRNARAVAGCNFFVLFQAKIKCADANIGRLNTLRTVKDRDRLGCEFQNR